MKSLFQRLARSPWLQVLLGCTISLWAIYLALEDISFQNVGLVFSKAKWGYLIPALMAVAVHHGVKTLRWKLLLSPISNSKNVHIPLKDLFLSLMAGQMLNLVYPGRLGDFSRIWLIGNRGYGKASTAGTLVVEKFIDTIWYALLLVSLTLLITIPDWLASSWIFLVGILISFGLLLFITSQESLWIKLSGLRVKTFAKVRLPVEQVLSWMQAFRSGITGFQQFQENQSFAWLFLWSATAWGMSLLINWLVAVSLGLCFGSVLDTVAAQMLVLVALQVGIAVPSLPGRIGLFEYICMLALGVFGVRSSDAFSYGVLLHIIVMVPTLLVGWAGLMIFGFDRKQVMDELTEN